MRVYTSHFTTLLADISKQSERLTERIVDLTAKMEVSEMYPKSHINFEPAAESLILSIIKDLDSTKSYQKGNIPPYILKNNKNIYSFFMDFILEEKCTWFGIEI